MHTYGLLDARWMLFLRIDGDAQRVTELWYRHRLLVDAVAQQAAAKLQRI